MSMHTIRQRDQLQQVYDRIMREEKLRRLDPYRVERRRVTTAGVFWLVWFAGIALAGWWVV